MTNRYKISGMTCSGCQAKVHALLSEVPGVKNIQIDLSQGAATIDMDRSISTVRLQAALKKYPNYQLSESGHHEDNAQITAEEMAEPKSWISTYKPILLVFVYIVGTTVLIEAVNGAFIWTRWIEHFMAGFFLVFSFFKLLNLKGFAESYSMYDIIARKWNGWGYIYAFIELGLGAAFLTGFRPILANSITLIVMSISIIGVSQSILNKRGIQCACLGAVFNLPLSTITIIEDALMIIMSGLMIITMLNG